MDDLQTTLQVPDSILVVRKPRSRDNVLERLIGNQDVLLLEIDLFANLGEKIVVRNDNLLLLIVSLRLDAVHAVAQDRVDHRLVIVTKDEESTTHIQFGIPNILVRELVVLCRISQMSQDADNLAPLFALTDLVQLVK